MNRKSLEKLCEDLFGISLTLKNKKDLSPVVGEEFLGSAQDHLVFYKDHYGCMEFLEVFMLDGNIQIKRT